MPVVPSSALGLVGRNRELTALVQALTRVVAGDGRVLAIVGAAGTGKSRLLGVVRELAQGHGISLRDAVAVELDRDLQMGVARRLLGGVTPPDRARTSSASLAEGGLASVHALVADVARRATAAPLLLCIDDLQWADEHTLLAVEAFCGLTRELPLGVAVAWRRAELDQRRVQRLLALETAVQFELHDLGADDTRTLVRRALPDAAGEFLDACHRVTGGNPFLLGELSATVIADGVQPDDDAAERILRLESATVRTAVLTRLGLMAPAAAALAHSVAVLGDATPLHHAARVAELAPGEAAEAADALVAVEILTGSEHLSFRHPLLGAVVLADIGAFRRAQLYRRAAEVVAADGLIDRAGALLLRAPPGGDATAVGLLRAAAASASRSGDPPTAVRLLKRALAEPSRPEDRGSLLVQIARAQAALGDPEALEHLDEALIGLERSSARARVLTEIARLHHVRSDFARGARLAERALAEIDDDDPSREWVLASWLMAAGLDPERAAQTTEVMRRLAAQTLAGSPPQHPELKASIAMFLICTFGDPDLVAAIADDAVRGDAHDSEDGLGLAVALALSALFYTGRMEMLERATALALQVAAERASILTAAAAAQWRGQARIALGDPRGALEDAETALLPYRYGWKTPAANAAGVRALALVELGDVGGALRALGTDVPLPYPQYFQTLGVVEFAAGAFDHALRAFADAGRMLEAVWEVDSPAVVPWRSGAAEAALGTGDRALAEQLSETELALARRTGVPLALGRATRVRGLVIGGEEGIGLLREACHTLGGGESRLELLRAELDLGAALRRAGARRQAREVLEGVRDRAARLGLVALADRARSEHAASGGRPRRVAPDGVGGLTPSELRIARLAASGQTNREIAAELFLTPKTVEWHLRHIFLKLEIKSRRALSAALTLGAADR